MSNIVKSEKRQVFIDLSDSPKGSPGKEAPSTPVQAGAAPARLQFRSPSKTHLIRQAKWSRTWHMPWEITSAPL